MNNVDKLDLNLPQNQNGDCGSSEGQHKNISIQDLRLRQAEEDNYTLTNRITELLSSKLEENQQSTDHNTQIKCAMKMLKYSRTKVDQCNEALPKLCKHQNLMVDVLNKTEDYRITVDPKVKNIEDKCKVTINKLCTKLQTTIDKQNQIVKENFNLQLKLNELIEENSALKVIINNQKLDIETIDAEFTEKISRLNCEKENIEIENRSLIDNYTNLENYNEATTEELNQAKQTISHLEEIIKGNINDLKTKQEMIENLKNEKNLLSKDIKTYIDENKNKSEIVEKIQEELNDKRESNVNLENEKLNLLKDIQLLNEKLNDLNASIVLDRQIVKKKENDFILREQFLKDEQNRLIIRLNTQPIQHSKPQKLNEWDTSQSDITEIPEKKTNLFSKPSKYVSLPSKRTATKAGFQWFSSQENKVVKYNTSTDNLQQTEVGSPEEIVTSSCK